MTARRGGRRPRCVRPGRAPPSPLGAGATRSRRDHRRGGRGPVATAVIGIASADDVGASEGSSSLGGRRVSSSSSSPRWSRSCGSSAERGASRRVHGPGRIPGHRPVGVALVRWRRDRRLRRCGQRALVAGPARLLRGRRRLRVVRPALDAPLPGGSRARAAHRVEGAPRSLRSASRSSRSACWSRTHDERAALDPLINPPARLMLLSMLSAVSEAEFATVRDQLDVSDSVLSKHVSALAAADYVASRKGVHRGRRTTWIGLTRDGPDGARRARCGLRAVIDGAPGRCRPR